MKLTLMNKKIKNFIEEFIKENKTLIFIETGTFNGTTSEWASKLFKVVYTIEKETHFFQAAEKKFNNTNVNCINGDSSTCLSSILKNIDDTVIFWLDAHWSCEDTSGEEKECPLLEEISIINKWNRDCVILIDDASDFLCSPPKPHKPDHWPSISEVINKLNDISSDFTDDISSLEIDLENIDLTETSSNNKNVSDIYGAILEAIEELDNLDTKLPKSILLLSEERNNLYSR